MTRRHCSYDRHLHVYRGWQEAVRRRRGWVTQVVT